MTDKPMKAYAALDGDERGCVVYATNGAAARRLAAAEMDTDFSGVALCRRAPGLDQFLGKPIPIEAMIGMGWWHDCLGCGSRIAEEDDEWGQEWQGADPESLICDDDVHLPKRVPVGVWGAPYCCASCRDDHRQFIVEKKTFEDGAVAALQADITKLYPGSTVGEVHAYVYKKDHEFRVKEVHVSFQFPGCLYGASLHRNEAEAGPRLYVANGDMEAWATFHAGLRAAASAG